MNDVIAGALGAFLTLLSVLGIQFAGPMYQGGTGTLNQLQHWSSDGDEIVLATTTAPIRVPYLTNCNTIDTDSDGTFACGSDDGGVGGSGFSTTSALYFSSVGLAFSTTSNDHWQTQRNFFSTTSANAWLSLNQGNAFSTTSANFWSSRGLGFSTTSANTWAGFGLGFSTTSANVASAAFIHGSTTIPKTYTANTFNLIQTFSLASSSAATSSISHYFPFLASAAGTFLAVDTTGKLIATTTPSTSGNSFAYPFPSNATNTALTFSNGLNVTGSTLAVTATTTSGALQVGSTAIGANVLKLSPLTGLTVSSSESVGGLGNCNTGTTDVPCWVLYRNSTGSTRNLSIVDDGADTGAALHVRDDGSTTAFNLSSAPDAQGAMKWSPQSAGGVNGSGISLDGSVNGWLGSTFFAICGTSDSCMQWRNVDGTAQMLRLEGDGKFGVATDNPTAAFQVGNAFMVATTTASTTVMGNLTFGGVTGNSWDDFCTTITGGSGLCDGSDDGAGASSFSTTSANHWATFGLAFSTTSNDYWKSVRNFFSTTSADYWETQQAPRGGSGGGNSKWATSTDNAIYPVGLTNSLVMGRADQFGKECLLCLFATSTMESDGAALIFASTTASAIGNFISFFDTDTAAEVFSVSASGIVSTIADFVAGDDLRLTAAGSAIELGEAGVSFTHDDDGALTLTSLGDGNQESVTLNLDDTADIGSWSSASGLVAFDYSQMRLRMDGIVIDGDGTFPASQDGTLVIGDGSDTGGLELEDGGACIGDGGCTQPVDGELTVAATTTTVGFSVTGAVSFFTNYYASFASFANGVVNAVTSATLTGTWNFSGATVKEHTYSSFTYATTTAWAGTTTIPLGPAYTAEDWVGAKCFTDAGTVQVSFNDGTNRMNWMNASTTVGTVTLSTNDTFTASEKRYVDVGTPASSPTKISCTIDKIVNN